MVDRLWRSFGRISIARLWSNVLNGVNDHAQFCLLVDGEKKKIVKPSMCVLCTVVFAVLRQSVLVSLQLKEWIRSKLASSFGP